MGGFHSFIALLHYFIMNICSPSSRRARLVMGVGTSTAEQSDVLCTKCCSNCCICGVLESLQSLGGRQWFPAGTPVAKLKKKVYSIKKDVI